MEEKFTLYKELLSVEKDRENGCRGYTVEEVVQIVWEAMEDKINIKGGKINEEYDS